MTINISIIGYGKMGHEIEAIAKQRGLNIISKVDPMAEDATHKEINEESMKDVEVAIDFTHPSVCMENMKKLTDLKKNVVLGTTGWYDEMDKMKSMVESSGIGLIWSGNFSIGVNMFFKMIKNAAKIVNNVKEYDVAIHNVHHNQKADSPSGTALMMGNIVLEEIDRKEKLLTEEIHRKIEPEELNISSMSVGSIPGTHNLIFDSPVDTIELKHTARSRAGFALGAVMAAEWVKGKTGFFEIDDFMKDLIK